MEGVGSLLQSALAVFPLESRPLLQLLAALASANRDSAAKVSSLYKAPLHHARLSYMDGGREIRSIRH